MVLLNSGCTEYWSTYTRTCGWKNCTTTIMDCTSDYDFTKTSGISEFDFPRPPVKLPDDDEMWFGDRTIRYIIQGFHYLVEFDSPFVGSDRSHMCVRTSLIIYNKSYLQTYDVMV
jgi:hypothetical protein